MPERGEAEAICACGPSEPFDWAAWWRIGLGIVIAANSMVVSLAVNTSPTEPSELRVVHAILGGLALAGLALLGWPLARNAVRALAGGRLTIEAMFLAGIAGALSTSMVAALTGVGEVYFEVVTILLVVYAIGQQLTLQAQDRALRAAIDWLPGVERCTVVRKDGAQELLDAAELRAGDHVLVAPGATIAADGVVIEGEAFVREAEMTGEHFAVVKRPGDRVWAGTGCVDASLIVRATSNGGSRRIDRILEVVDRARRAPSSIQYQADRVVARFLPAVVGVAVLTFVGWSLARGWETALFNAMAVLLVACPCALGLATPLAVWAAIGRLAARGLVAERGDVVERLAAVDMVVFDKTGTLTGPRARLVDLVVAEGLDRSELLGLVRAVELESRHPVGAAFCAPGEERPAGVVVDQLRVVPGFGVRGRVRRRGDDVSRVIEIGTAETPPRGGREAELAARLRAGSGSRRIVVRVDGTVAGLAAIDERLRASWPEALARLRAAGLETLVMTGDRAERGRSTGADAVIGDMGPEAKLAAVERLRRAGRKLLFVGDGVNDAAAMAASDVSVAVASGADLASGVADVAWHGGDLRVLPSALELARATLRTIRTNLALALGYNLIGISLAVAGVLHPVAAALLMTCSSLVVTWRATAVLQEEGSETTARPVGGAALAEGTAG